MYKRQLEVRLGVDLHLRLGVDLEVQLGVDPPLRLEVDLEVRLAVDPVAMPGVDLAVLLEVGQVAGHKAEAVLCTAGPEVILVALHAVDQQALRGVVGVQGQLQAVNQCKGFQSQKDQNRMVLLLVQMLNSLVRHLHLLFILNLNGKPGHIKKFDNCQGTAANLSI